MNPISHPLRPGGTYESSPAIYRRVRYYTGLRPGGTTEYRRLMRQSRGPAFAKLNRFSHRNFDRPSGTKSNFKYQYRR
jgi:hypothetical protein